MRRRNQLADRAPLIVVGLLGWVCAGILAGSLGAPMLLLVPAAAVVLATTAVVVAVQVGRERRFADQLTGALTHLDITLALSDLIDVPAFAVGRQVHHALRRMAWAMSDQVAVHRDAEAAHRAYVEAWIHEIKLPITNLYLLAATTPDLPPGVLAEAERINRHAQQALYYARSLSVHQDYRIRPVVLGDVVDRVLRELATPMVAAGTSVEVEGLDVVVLSDPQWLDFIVTQLLLNATQYRSVQPLRLRIAAVQRSGGTTLTIADNGIGIAAQDLPRVFDKGFVGANGRNRQHSTGIGLYLCRRLCRQMNIELSVSSTVGSGTQLELTFAHERGVLLDPPDR